MDIKLLKSHKEVYIMEKVEVKTINNPSILNPGINNFIYLLQLRNFNDHWSRLKWSLSRTKNQSGEYKNILYVIYYLDRVNMAMLICGFILFYEN